MGFGNINKMMKQAQKMQRDIAVMQEELGNRIIEASAGGGVVQVKVNGKQELLEIKLKPEIVDPEDIEMLQDLIMAAVNEGNNKSREMVAQEMSKITGGLNIPGLT
ncbi:MAG: YbaB/EbfC family nucleoid-associated protein [Solirubrobacterales bacterium]